VGTIALLIGVGVMLRRRPKLALLWLGFAIPYLLGHMVQQKAFMRNLSPLITLSALPIGVAAAEIVEWVRDRRPRVVPLAGAAVALALYAAPLYEAVTVTAYRGRPYTKALAAEYVKSLPKGRRIGVEEIPRASIGGPMVRDLSLGPERTADWYRAHHYRYLVANADRHTGQTRAAYEELKLQGTVVHVIPGNEAGQPGPWIEVLDLGQDPEGLGVVRRAAQFGADLRLHGYELRPGEPRQDYGPLNGADERVLKSGEAVQINLLWQAGQRLPVDYTVFIHVLDQDGNKVAQRDAPIRQADYPTSHWLENEIVVDHADLPLPALPPGRYSLVIGVYDPATGARLPVVEPRGETDGTSLVLTTLEVR